MSLWSGLALPDGSVTLGISLWRVRHVCVVGGKVFSSLFPEFPRGYLCCVVASASCMDRGLRGQVMVTWCGSLGAQNGGEGVGDSGKWGHRRAATARCLRKCSAQSGVPCGRGDNCVPEGAGVTLEPGRDAGPGGTAGVERDGDRDAIVRAVRSHRHPETPGPPPGAPHPDWPGFTPVSLWLFVPRLRSKTVFLAPERRFSAGEH